MPLSFVFIFYIVKKYFLWHAILHVSAIIVIPMHTLFIYLFSTWFNICIPYHSSVEVPCIVVLYIYAHNILYAENIYYRLTCITVHICENAPVLPTCMKCYVFTIRTRGNKKEHT